MQKKKSTDLFTKEVMEKDALNRIAWDKDLDPGEFEVYYIDRFSNTLSKVKFTEIQVEGDYFRREESLIPLHRIRRIAHKGVVVWEKRKTGG